MAVHPVPDSDSPARTLTRRAFLAGGLVLLGGRRFGMSVSLPRWDDSAGRILGIDWGHGDSFVAWMVVETRIVEVKTPSKCFRMDGFAKTSALP